jgi:hypothetical protein
MVAIDFDETHPGTAPWVFDIDGCLVEKGRQGAHPTYDPGSFFIKWGSENSTY